MAEHAFERFEFVLKFGVSMAYTFIAISALQIIVAITKNENAIAAVQCVACLGGVVYAIQFIMSCAYAYSEVGKDCSITYYSGQVLYWYCTVQLTMMGITAACGLICCMMLCCLGAKANENEGG